ncbi:MAG TPA: type I restriction-modification system subunit M N-terminal domain-containing protein [Chthoniobacterales bacterium]|nr:type I restriction-modification system subunit M N-terminal domain-containing protein [Chthoniobacterales bacterium]
MSSSTALVQKLWNYCNILRDDGLSYGDYVEQLTFLLFLKMADEQSKPPFNKSSPIPPEYSWPSLLKRDGDDLEVHYRHTLEELGKRSGMLGIIFRKAQNKIQDPAKLRRLIVDLIDKLRPRLMLTPFAAGAACSYESEALPAPRRPGCSTAEGFPLRGH